MAPQTRSRHEEEQVQRRTDCQDIARGGSGFNRRSGQAARLKKLVAERDLEIEVMKEIAAKKW
jgi:hypothetical protein